MAGRARDPCPVTGAMVMVDGVTSSYVRIREAAVIDVCKMFAVQSAEYRSQILYLRVC